MSKNQELAQKLAEAVFRQIESDRAINKNNLAEAMLKELAVAAEHGQPTVADEALVRLVTYTQDLIYQMKRNLTLPDYAKVQPYVNLVEAQVSKMGFF